jgi:hypothetical protein
MKNTIFLLVLVSLSILSCTKQEKKITNSNDYNSFLELNENKALDFSKDEIKFWQTKFNKAPNQITFLSQIASNYSKLFEITGNIDDLKKAEELLVKSNEAFKYTQVGTLRSLARNYISQHRFKEALELANKAYAIGEGKKESQKLLFDVQMELGNYTEAQKNLYALQDFKNFDYLIRLSKWNDHLGDLKSAVSFMEQAAKIAEKEDSQYLKVWSYSNLADIYGHEGRIQDSYNYYLKTLKEAPHNTYALKGIAWIAFSYEKNAKEANRIVDVISKRHHSPDFYLLKSQIAQFVNNTNQEEHNKNEYFKMLENQNYGAMYNKYNTLIHADNPITVAKALEIAKIEVDHRPTPDSYDLLAWSYLNLGEAKKALEIAQKHVIGKSFEPKVNYHIAEIYKANKMFDEVLSIKEELKASYFEVGPNMASKIEKL